MWVQKVAGFCVNFIHENASGKTHFITKEHNY